MTDLTWVLSSCVLILAVIAIRATFGKRMNPKLRYALWGLVLLRLLYPGTVLSSPVSVQGVAEQTEVVQNFEAVRGVDSIEHMANGSVEGFDRYALMPERPVTVAEQVTPERFARMETTIRARDMLEPIWIVGIVVTAIAFLISNLRFYHTLRKRRKPLDADCPLRVYSVENLSSSCLFGSAIYVAAETAADETRLRHVLAHELSHHRHGDHVWTFLRCVVLALHWYNPLVWWAAALSRQDSELCADAGALKRLGEDERENYGATLIELSARRAPRASLLCTATTMTNGKKSLKERVTMIARRPRMTVAVVIVVVLIAVVAAGCAFTGATARENEATTETQSEVQAELPSSEPSREWIALTALPEGYALEDAKRDGCVVHEDGTVTAGQETWSEFLAATEEQRPAFVRIAKNYTLGDASHYDPAYYELVKDEFPRLYLFDLDYDGEGYTVRWFDGDGEHVERYPYLVRCAGKAESPTARYRGYVRCLLTNDEGVTWDDVWRSMISSRSDDDIPYFEAYTELLDYVPDEEQREAARALFATLGDADPAELMLTYAPVSGETPTQVRAGASILAEEYLRMFADIRWSEASPKEATDAYLRLEGSGWRLTSYLQTNACVCFEAEGQTLWFVAAEIPEDAYGRTLRHKGDDYRSALFDWYDSALAAEANRGRGTPLTADELFAWREELASSNTEGDTTRPTLVSCFFTSFYDDPRDLDLVEFLAYCPLGEPVEDEAEFDALNLDWEIEGGVRQRMTLDQMPSPTWRYRAARIDEALMQYAGITLDDMSTDWRATALYVPEYDAFYNFTSDFGPGVFQPDYGERSGNTVTLYCRSGEGTRVLTLRYMPDGGYHILSHLSNGLA